MLNFEQLQSRQWEKRAFSSPAPSLRTHRALSWLNRAEQEADDEDARRVLGRTDTTRVLAEIFDRLYTLRYQIVHGGSTWNSGVNGGQMKDGANILGFLVPTIIHLMMENHDQLWGDPCYPVVE